MEPNTPRLPDDPSIILKLIEVAMAFGGELRVRPKFPMPEWIFLDKAQK